MSGRKRGGIFAEEGALRKKVRTEFETMVESAKDKASPKEPVIEERRNASRAAKSGFGDWLNKVLRGDRRRSDEKEERNVKKGPRYLEARKEFTALVNRAREEERPRGGGPAEPPRGLEKKSLSDLTNRNDYVKVRNENFAGVNFLIRRGTETVSKNLFMREGSYEVEIRTSAEVEDLTIAGFIGNLWDVFDTIFTECLKFDEYDEICFHATHRDLEGSLSSSIYELKEENRDAVIYEIMNRITGWSQSGRPGAAVKHLQISVTLLKRNIPGEGVLLAIGDDNLRRKAFSRENFNGSIFYVDCEKDCFFVSIFYGLVYNSYQKMFNATGGLEEKKNIHREYYKVLELKGENLVEEAKSFYRRRYGLDTDDYEQGSEVFLRELYRKGSCQVSIFSDRENYRRVLMVPEEYEPLLEHVNILLTQYLRKTEPRKTVQREKDFAQYHYHGLRVTARGFGGQSQSFCVYCGVYYSYTAVMHCCKKSDTVCEVCARPVLEKNLVEKISLGEQTNFCFEDEGYSRDPSKQCCKVCKKNGKNKLCYEIHIRSRCRNRVRCSECKRTITLTGKYSTMRRSEPVKKHDNCEEIFCHTCGDYAIGYDDLKNPTHVCYVPVIKKAKLWPSLIVCFDFETYPCDEEGTMRANLIHMMYQAEPNDCTAEFRGIFFTDVPMEAVKLNGQVVTPGVEYIPDMAEDLKDYYPYEVLLRELPEGDKQIPDDAFVEKKKKKNNVGYVREDEPYDPIVSCVMRNLLCVSEEGSEPAHLDVFAQQLEQLGMRPLNSANGKIKKTGGDSAAEVKGYPPGKKDWREKIRCLEEIDRRLEDKFVFSGVLQSECEAREEEEAFNRLVESANKKKRGKKRLAGLSSRRLQKVGPTRLRARMTRRCTLKQKSKGSGLPKAVMWCSNPICLYRKRQAVRFPGMSHEPRRRKQIIWSAT